MTKNLTLALMISLLSFLSLGPLGNAYSEQADVQFFTGEDVSLGDNGTGSGYDI